MNDRRVETGGHRLMKEDGVEDLTHRRVQPEGDIGQAEGRLHARVHRLELPNGIHRLDCISTRLLLPGGDGKGERVDEDVRDVHAPVVGEVTHQSVGNAHLPLRRPSLPLLVDGQRHDAGTMLHHERHDAPDTRVGSVAILVVH